MKKRLSLLLFGVPLFCLSTGFLRFPEVNALMAAARVDGSTGIEALGWLEQIALGHLDAITPEAESRFQLAKGSLHAKVLEEEDARCYTMARIGEMGSPAAIQFLSGLRPLDVLPDNSSKVWFAARIALATAQLRQIHDPIRRQEFLLTTLKVTPDWWVAEELCNEGFADALDEIRRIIRKNMSGPSGQLEVQYCEDRVQVLSRSPDRARALATVLDSAIRLGNTGNTKLVRWAIAELATINSDDSKAALERFDQELKQFTDADPKSAPLWDFRAALDAALGKKTLLPAR